MTRLMSWTGLVLAAFVALAFVALYLDYLSHAGTWFADLPLVLAALPFTAVMRALNGGRYVFAADMTGRIIAAAAFCSALAYVAGLAIETGARKLIAVIRKTWTGSTSRPSGRPSLEGGWTRAGRGHRV